MNREQKLFDSAIFSVALLFLVASLVAVLRLETFVPLSSFVDRQLAFVGGMSASVAPNEVNLLAQQLDAKERSLNARERELLAREDALAQRLRAEVMNEYLWAVALLVLSIIFLLALVGMNFYLDAVREKRREGKVVIPAGERETRL